MSIDAYFDAEKFTELVKRHFPTNTLPDGTKLTQDLKYTLAMNYYFQPSVSQEVNNAGAEWESHVMSRVGSAQDGYSVRNYETMKLDAEQQGVKYRIIARNARRAQLRDIDLIFKTFFEKQLEENGLVKLNDIYSMYIEMALLTFDDDSKKFSELGQALTMILLSGGIVAGFWPNSPGGVWPDGNLVVYWPHDHEPKFAPITKF